ncbi:MAG: DsrE family protein [Deltaproteobacteria bacterium]|nr:DsrE family protein [Deltaproteobacteria bacterium]
MKLGLIIYSSDPETVWNAFRLGNFALKKGDAVKVFLLAKGVECESLDTDHFKITDQMKAFVEGSGEILTCGTCLKIREQEASELCPLSTMSNLYDMVAGCDRVLSF